MILNFLATSKFVKKITFIGGTNRSVMLDVLCAMKLSALLSRAKGRDFYDALFLLSQTKPNYDFLTQKQDIHNLTELKTKLTETIEKVDLQHKSKDFEHLLFNKVNKDKILNFREFIERLGGVLQSMLF